MATASNYDPLSSEINAIALGNNKKFKNDSNTTGQSEVTGFLHTVDYDMSVQIFESLDIKRDYNSNMGDEVFARFFLPLGDFVKHVYPNRDNLEITVIKKGHYENTSYRYKFVINNNKKGFDGNRFDRDNQDDLNEESLAYISGQCIDRTLEVLRIIRVSGNYRNTTVGKVMTSILKHHLDQSYVPNDNVTKILKIHKPDNTRVYNNIIIPTNTPLMSLPLFLQEKNYGVYNGNIGSYLQKIDKKTVLSIYPLYKYNAFEKNKNKLIIFSPNNRTMEQIENTFTKDDDTVKIIAKTKSGIEDISDLKLMDTGYGIESLEVDSLISRTGDVKKNQLEIPEDGHISNHVHKEAKDGVLHKVVKKPTNNHYRNRSDVLKDHGVLITVEWAFSASELLRPDMSIVYFTSGDKNKIIKLTGTLQGSYSVVDNKSKMEVTTLILHVNKEVK